MTWLRWETTTPQSDVVGHLAEELNVPLPHALGLYIACCLTFGEHRPDGLATAVTDASLEQWALWTGKRGQFAAAFRARCVSDGTGHDAPGVVRGWWRQRALIEKQEADRLKRKPPRNPRGYPTKTPEKPPENPSEKPGDVNTSRLVPLVPEISTTERDPREPRIREALPADCRATFDGFLRASHNPTALLGELEMLGAGAGIPGATWQHIGAALTDLSLAGSTQLTGKQLRAFVKGAMRESPAGSAPEDEYQAAARILGGHRA